MKNKTHKKNANCVCEACVTGRGKCQTKAVKAAESDRPSWKKLAEALGDNVRLAALAAGLIFGGAVTTQAAPDTNTPITKEAIAMHESTLQDNQNELSIQSTDDETTHKKCNGNCPFEAHFMAQLEAARLAAVLMFGPGQDNS